MKIVGLTGGIGTGKSTVSRYLKNLGITVVDADEMSRALTAENGKALGDIRRLFGDGVFFEDGTLDRRALAGIVFGDPEKRRLLESVTTDVVVSDIKNKIAELRAISTEETEGRSGDIAIIDAPLLFECGIDEFTDENWLVTAEQEVRLGRVMLRDGVTREEVLRRIESQMPEEEKLKKADKVLDNSSGLGSLYAQVDRLLAG